MKCYEIFGVIVPVLLVLWIFSDDEKKKKYYGED